MKKGQVTKKVQARRNFARLALERLSSKLVADKIFDIHLSINKKVKS